MAEKEVITAKNKIDTPNNETIAVKNEVNIKDSSSTDSEYEDYDDLEFSDLEDLEFTFASGAGGWSTSLIIKFSLNY